MSLLRCRILGLMLSGVAVFLAVALLGYSPADAPRASAYPQSAPLANICGVYGASMASSLLHGLGFFAYLLVVGFFVESVRLLRGRPGNQIVLRFIGILLLLTAFSGLAALFVPLSPGTPSGPGGCLGAMVKYGLISYFTTIGAVLILGSMVFAGIILTFDIALIRVILLLRRIVFGGPVDRNDIQAEVQANGQVQSYPPQFSQQETNPDRHGKIRDGAQSLAPSLTPSRALPSRVSPGASQSSLRVQPENTFSPGAGRATGAEEAGEYDLEDEYEDADSWDEEGAQDEYYEEYYDEEESDPDGYAEDYAVDEYEEDEEEEEYVAGESYQDDSGYVSRNPGRKSSSQAEQFHAEPRSVPQVPSTSLAGSPTTVASPTPAPSRSGGLFGWLCGSTDSNASTGSHDFSSASLPPGSPGYGGGTGSASFTEDGFETDASLDPDDGANDAPDADGEAQGYRLPSLDILTPSPPFDYEAYEAIARQQARKLEKSFLDYNFNVRVVDIQTGPVIAQFEIQLEKGLRLQKIQGLMDDLAVGLKVPSVRLVTPLPGKNTVGIELPNPERQMVRMRDVIEQSEEETAKMAIPIYLGMDATGRALPVDLAKLPHLLIAGRTGTGKSVCLNSIIVSMLMTRKPDEVKMLMIDPKMVELSPYKTIPHLLYPVVTDMKKAEAILGWAVDKMEERYQLLASVGVRQLSEYNKLTEEQLYKRLKPATTDEWEAVPKKMPYLVIIADEMGDLMMTCGKEVESHIIRLAQKSRAVGIHLVLATQKPTVDVITGLIKSNLPARIAFEVASRSDSQVVLDRNGAEKLLGNGDMLFLRPGTSQVVRGQGTYVSNEEMEAIVENISTGEQEFDEELVALDELDEEDDFYDDYDDEDDEGGIYDEYDEDDDVYEAPYAARPSRPRSTPAKRPAKPTAGNLRTGKHGLVKSSGAKSTGAKSTGGKAGSRGSSVQRDELYHKAVEHVIREGRGSTSLLQQKLGIGYGRASRMIGFMAKDGVVGEHNGSQAREVIISLSQWKRRLAAGVAGESSGKARPGERPKTRPGGISSGNKSGSENSFDPRRPTGDSAKTKMRESAGINGRKQRGRPGAPSRPDARREEYSPPPPPPKPRSQSDPRRAGRKEPEYRDDYEEEYVGYDGYAEYGAFDEYEQEEPARKPAKKSKRRKLVAPTHIVVSEKPTPIRGLKRIVPRRKEDEPEFADDYDVDAESGYAENEYDNPPFETDDDGYEDAEYEEEDEYDEDGGECGDDEYEYEYEYEETA